MSSQKSIAWLEKYGLKYQKCKIQDITSEELLEILVATTDGINQIIKSPDNGFNAKQAWKKIITLQFSEALEFLCLNTSVIRTPIIMQKDKLLVGYNADEIRMFLPSQFQRRKLIKDEILNNKKKYLFCR